MMDFSRQVFEKAFTEMEYDAVAYLDADGTYRHMTSTAYVDAVYAISERVAELCADIPRGSWTAIDVRVHHLWIAVYFALLKCGYNVIFLSHEFDRETTGTYLCQEDVKILVTDKDVTFADVKVLGFDQLVEGPLEPAERVPLSEQQPWGDYYVSCTSGTTGSTCKLLLHTSKALLHSMNGHNERVRANSSYMEMFDNVFLGRRYLMYLPVNYVYGFEACLLFWTLRMEIYFRDTRGVFDLVETVRECGIYMFPAVPLIWETLYHSMVARFGEASPEAFEQTFGPNLRVGLNAGASTDPIVMAGYRKLGLNIIDIYGLTEVPMIFVKQPNAANPDHFNFAISPIEKRVALEDGTLIEQGTGELVVKGEGMFAGYLSEGEILPPELDENGWFRTGDIFELSEKGAFFLGRCKNIIVGPNGQNIYPEELEFRFNFLQSQSANYRVTELDDAPVMFVQMREGGPSREELIERIRKTNGSLPIYKRITRLFLTDEEMPMSKLKGVLARALPGDLADNPGKYHEEILIKGRN